jgi:hypothetical protein
MSFQAMTWAVLQKTGHPRARNVLFALANRAGDFGESFLRLERIAEESEQSRSSVIRALARLEKLGLLYRTPERRHESGTFGGRFTSSMTFLLMNEACVQEALRHGYDPEAVKGGDLEPEAADEEDGPENDARAGESTAFQYETRSLDDVSENNGLAEDKNHGGSNWNAVDSARSDAIWNADRVSLLEREPISKEPLTPQSPPDASTGAALDGGSWLADWDRFLHAWPWAAGELPEQARRTFRKLAPEDRAAAIGFIPAYLAEVRRRQGKAMQARRWVGFRGWEPFALAAKKNLTAKPGSSVPVIKDSAAWKAWLAARGARSFPTRRQLIEGKVFEVWDFPTLWPPGAARNAENVDGRAGAAGLGNRENGAAR